MKSTAPAPDLEDLERALGYTFHNRSLLARAMTHSSRANEIAAPGSPAVETPADNERLEFLGDSVLGLLVSEWLFSRYTSFSEGQLSLVKNHLVSAVHLVDTAQALDLGRYLQLGRGEESTGGRSKQRILANSFEAVLAAVYLDGGMDAARSLVMRCIPGNDEILALAGAGPPLDSRAELDRLARERGLGKPEYLLLGETGPGHARRFRVEVRVGDLMAAGEGSSKKAAAHEAAREACRVVRLGAVRGA